MKSSAISASAPVRRAASAWPSSWMSVSTAIISANGTPYWGPLMATISTANSKNPGRTWTGKPSSRNAGVGDAMR